MRYNASDRRKQAVRLRRLAEEAERPNDRAYLSRLAQWRDREARELELRETSRFYRGSRTDPTVGTQKDT